MRFAIRRQLRVQELIESLKLAVVDIAVEELHRLGEEPNVSRISALTGLHRRDVVRIFRDGETKEYSVNLVNQVIGQWQADPRFQTQSRQPRVLSVEGPDADFRQLMKTVHTDLKPGTVLFELERMGAVKRVKNGVKLIVKTYEPKHDPRDVFEIVADDTNDLITAVDENTFLYEEAPHLHAKTVYDNISPEDLPKIKQWLLRQGADFHRKARTFLAQFDLDINPASGKRGGARVAVGTFTRLSSDEKDSHLIGKKSAEKSSSLDDSTEAA